jgi:hypothetical protein
MRIRQVQFVLAMDAILGADPGATRGTAEGRPASRDDCRCVGPDDGSLRRASR